MTYIKRPRLWEPLLSRDALVPWPVFFDISVLKKIHYTLKGWKLKQIINRPHKVKHKTKKHQLKLLLVVFGVKVSKSYIICGNKYRNKADEPFWFTKINFFKSPKELPL